MCTFGSFFLSVEWAKPSHLVHRLTVTSTSLGDKSLQKTSGVGASLSVSIDPVLILGPVLSLKLVKLDTGCT